MEFVCYRCGEPVDENAAFCPACGAPQIKVSRREEDTPEAPSAPIPPPSPVQASPLVPGVAEGRIDWHRFLRMAWLPAIIAGLATAFYAPVGLLVVVPLTVTLTIRTYMKQNPLPLRAAQGAKMGIMAGFVSFVAFALLVLGLVSMDTAHIREEWTHAALQAASRNPDPHVQETLRSIVSTDQGFYLVVGISLVFFLVIVVGFTALTGAIAAATLSRRRA
jgi:hypothetical protein